MRDEDGPKGITTDLPFGYCRKGETEDGNPKQLTTAFALDAENYHAELRVLPEHYCNQWKAKP